MIIGIGRGKEAHSSWRVSHFSNVNTISSQKLFFFFNSFKLLFWKFFTLQGPYYFIFGLILEKVLSAMLAPERRMECYTYYIWTTRCPRLVSYTVMS